MDVHSDHSEDESTAPGSSNGSVYLTPSVSGMDIDNKLTQSAFEVIESDEVKSETIVESDTSKPVDEEEVVIPSEPENESKASIVSVNDDSESGDSESTDDSVNTTELPELVEIENPDDKKDDKEVVTEDTNDDEPSLPEWEDILGTGRLHVKRITQGTGEPVSRISALKIEILIPSVPFDIKFGTADCILKTHSTLEILLGDQIDPVPGAIELALHGMATGGEIAIRSHKDLRGDLPDEFQVKVLEIMETDNLKQAEDSKNLGNKCYKSADYEKAVRYYERGIGYINEYQSENEASEEAKDLWIKISKNLGRSFFKLGKHGPSLDKFDEILNLFPNDLDVLLLKVEVLSKENKLDTLLTTCKLVLSLDQVDAKTKDKIKGRIEKAKLVQQKQDERYKKMCQRMAGVSTQKSNPIESVPVPAAATTTSNQENGGSFSTVLIGGALVAVVASIVAFSFYREKLR